MSLASSSERVVQRDAQPLEHEGVLMELLMDVAHKCSVLELVCLLRRRYFRRAPLQRFDDTHPCIFVLSTGRVGTQTLAALLGLSPNVFAYHEPSPTLYPLSRFAYELGDDMRVRGVFREAFIAARNERFDCCLKFKKGYVETSPQATFLAPAILEAIPDVKFIHVVRGPGYVVRSAMRRKWYAGNPADRTRIAPRPESEWGKTWNKWDAFEKNTWLWAETNRWIREFWSYLAVERRLLLDAEKIFDGNNEQLDRLFSFVGSSRPSKRKIVRILDKRLNRQTTGSFPKPCDWPESMRLTLRTIAGKEMDAFGYEL